MDDERVILLDIYSEHCLAVKWGKTMGATKAKRLEGKMDGKLDYRWELKTVLCLVSRLVLR